MEELAATKRRVNGLRRTNNRNTCGLEFRNGLCGLAGTTKVDEGSDEAFITAHFHVARARGKLPTVDSLKESLKEYEFIAAYLKAHPIAALAGEAQICDEMIELLPRRIAGIAAGR